MIMDPEITVRHIFNFTLPRSLLNAYRKSKYWIIYSMMNKDLLADSGTASRELKINGISWLACLSCALLWALTGAAAWIFLFAAIAGLNSFVSRGLFAEFYKTRGFKFSFLAALYYLLLYPPPVWAGTAAGVIGYVRAKYRKP